MAAETALKIWESGGPLALAFIVESLLLLSAMAVIVALVKWQSTFTVPISIYEKLCLGFERISASLDDLRYEIARGSKR